MSVHLLKGHCLINPQKVKYENQQNEDVKDYVTIFIYLLRLGAPFDSDIVMTYYVADKITDEESGQQAPGQSQAYLKFLEKSEMEFKTMVNNFCIEST